MYVAVLCFCKGLDAVNPLTAAFGIRSAVEFCKEKCTEDVSLYLLCSIIDIFNVLSYSNAIVMFSTYSCSSPYLNFHCLMKTECLPDLFEYEEINLDNLL